MFEAKECVTIVSSAAVSHATALFNCRASKNRRPCVRPDQSRLAVELYSQGQASMVLAQLGLVQPVQSSTSLSKFLEVVPPASRSAYNFSN